MRNFEMYPTIITPFLDDGSIDYISLERLVDMFASVGCDGIFAVCQSSEMFFLADEERLELARQSLNFCRKHGLKCIASGHVQDRIEDQINYLQALEGLGVDAIVLVSNRLALEDESDEIAVENLKRICSALSPKTRLGIYECPYPYKRELTPSLISAMIEIGHFDFIKDTCCRIDEIRHRIAQLEGSGIGLYNANSATLMESLEAGAAGYCGVQLNLMPEFFSLLKNACAEQNRTRMKLVCEHIAGVGFVECQNYPANAKYLLMKRGVISTIVTRNGNPPMTESQMKQIDAFEALNSAALFHLLKHEPIQLMFGYDTAFPECHASTVLPVEDGRVLSVYFAGTCEKHDDVGIWLSEQVNGAWQPPRLLAKVDDTPHWNPVIFENDGVIRVLFKVGKVIPGWRSYIMSSADGGHSWSTPKPINDDNPAGGPVRNKPLLLSDGRLLAPNSDETKNPAVWLPRVDESTDGGATFTFLAQIPINREDPDAENYMYGAGAIQPTLWESKPGHVHALMRTTAGWIYRSDSEDGGRTWCTAYRTALPNNNSGIDLVRVRDELYLVLNPVRGNWAARTPIAVMRSADNGEHFEYFRVLADMQLDEAHGRRAAFAYPAIVEKDGVLYITFTYNRKSIAFCRIDLR